MKCYTIESPGVVEPGIPVGDGVIELGARPFDGKLLRIPIDPRGVVSDGRLTEQPGRGALIVIRDHAGEYGSWHVRDGSCEERWDSMLAAEAIPNALDIRRRGRLNGTPSVFRVTCAGGAVVVTDPRADAEARRVNVATRGA